MPSRAAATFFAIFAILSALDLDAHGAGGAGNHGHCGFNVISVEILHLLFGDVTKLSLRDGASAILARQLGAGLEVERLLDEIGHRRLLHLESEALVGIGGNHGRNGRTLFQLLRGRIEGLAEFHDVEAALTERGTDRGRWRGRASRHLELDIARNLLSHFSSFYIARTGS